MKYSINATIAATAVIIASSMASAISADLPAGHPPISGTSLPVPSHTGVVTEAFPVSSYVYLHVKSADGEEWLAGPSLDIKPAAKVRWNDGAIMKNFMSKSLNRTFDSIRFVEVLEKAD